MGLAIALCLPIILVYANSISLKETRYVGALLSLAYPIAAVTISGALIYLVSTQGLKMSRELKFIAIFIPYISILSWTVLPNGFAERMGIFAFSLVIPILAVFVFCRVRQRVYLLVSFTFVVVAPVLTFYKSMLI